MFQPTVSVVVRSYKRKAELLELLDILRHQRYPELEIVVCDQSGDPELLRCVEAIADPRIVLVVREPLGPAGGRNEAVRHARGEIVIMIDDDDYPIGDGWIAAHVENYRDPRCQGVAGRCVATPEQAEARPTTARARRNVMKLSFWGDGTCYAWLGERKQGVDFLFGTNGSFRRSLVDRIGGWDEVPRLHWGEEQSFSLKFREARRAGEYFVFDPRPVAVRRTVVEGGCARRSGRGWYVRELASRVIYFHKVAGFYYPLRFRLLYPLYQLRTYIMFVGWIWDRDNAHQSVGERIVACAVGALSLPWLLVRWGLMPSEARIRRVRRLERPAFS